MIEARFLIEAQGNHKAVVENSLKKLSEKLEKEDGITLKKKSMGEVIEEDGMFSSILEADLEFSGFLSFVRASMFYTPSAVEMMEPAELLLEKDEFLEGIAEIISISSTVFSKLNVKFNIEGEKREKIGLVQEEIEQLLDEGAIRAKIVVEKTGKTRSGALSNLQRTLGDQVHINAIKSKKVKSEKPFEGVIGIDALISEPAAFVDIAVMHTPVLVDIKEPDEVRLTLLDLQDICLNLAGTFFELSYKITHGDN